MSTIWPPGNGGKSQQRTHKYANHTEPQQRRSKDRPEPEYKVLGGPAVDEHSDGNKYRYHDHWRQAVFRLHLAHLGAALEQSV